MSPKNKLPLHKIEARAKCYVPLYDMLCEIVHAIKDDPEASAELRALARRGRQTLDTAKSMAD